MKMDIRFPVCLAGILLAAGTVGADDGSRRDPRAIEVLESMGAYTASLDRVVISGVTLTDSRLGAGLMVANATEVEVAVDRPGSLHIASFDGVQKKELYFHDGQLTVYDSERKYYAQANIPNDIEAAMEFALEELDVEAPLMDMIYRDSSVHLIGQKQTILYLADKTRIAGTNCHHIAIRGSDADVQIWVEEGDRPVPRKVMITSKWEGGSPRFVSNMTWVPEPDFDPDTFRFTPPEGSTNIGFIRTDRGEED
jgi:hypothetical protein